MGIGATVIATLLAAGFIVAWVTRLPGMLRAHSMQRVASSLHFEYQASGSHWLLETFEPFDFFPARGSADLYNVLSRTRGDAALVVVDCHLPRFRTLLRAPSATVAVLRTPRRHPPRFVVSVPDCFHVLSMPAHAVSDGPRAERDAHMQQQILHGLRSTLGEVLRLFPRLTVESTGYGVLVHAGRILPAGLIPALCHAADEIGHVVREVVPEGSRRTGAPYRRLEVPQPMPPVPLSGGPHSEIDELYM